MLPCASPSTWISMCRGWSMNFSMKTRSSPKAVLGLGPAGREALGGLLVVAGDPQASAAAAGRGLDHHRIADLAGDLHGLARPCRSVRCNRGSCSRRPRGPASWRRSCLPSRRSSGGLGPMKTIPSSSSRRAELRVLGEEAIAGMDGLGPGLLAGGDDPVDGQVRLARGRQGQCKPPRRPASRDVRSCRPPNTRRPTGCPSCARS